MSAISNQRPWLFPLTGALLVLASGCAGGDEAFLDIGSAEERRNGVSGPTDLPIDPLQPPPPGEEVCDGWDNDRDGQIDEGTDGLPCSTSASSAGTSRCLNGRLICEECTPGETRQVDCGCAGATRNDVCNDAGRWLTGACDTCEQSLDSTSCGFCGVRGSNGQCIDAGVCEPGDTMYVRCDNCPANDPSCGTSCYGEKWQCAGNCQWVKVEACTAQQSECNRDEVYYQECGMCGYQKVECDGCFWTPGTCQDEGICVPGTTELTPCFGDACAEGLYARVTCNAQCEWVTQDSCQGCIPGPPVFATYACMPGYDCGEYTVRSECVATTRSICDGAETITVGQEQSTTVASSCAVACTPGATTSQSCHTPEGMCGSQAVTCAADCQWGAPAPGSCVALPQACVPGTQTVTTEVRDCNYCGETNKLTLTTTCTCRADGCGTFCSTTTSGSCPPCAPGMQSSVSCTDGAGCGGWAPVSCTTDCQWGNPGQCVNPNHCTPSTQTYGCPDGCHTYTMVTSCDSCGGSSTTSDYQTACQSSCSLGQTRSVPCGNCGQVRIDQCNTTCSGWVEGACPPDTCG